MAPDGLPHQVLLMLRVRVNTGSATSGVLEPSDDYDERSAVWHFIERSLPKAGLWAEGLAIDACHGSDVGHSMRGLRLYRVHRLPASPTMSSSERPGAHAVDKKDEARAWQVAHDGAQWQAAHDGAQWQDAHHEDGHGAPSRALQQRLQEDGKPAAAAGVVAGVEEGTGPASGPLESDHLGQRRGGRLEEGTGPASGPLESDHLGQRRGGRLEELKDALVEAEAEGVRARAAKTAAESPFIRLTPEEARARGFREDEELLMPMPVEDSSDEED